MLKVKAESLPERCDICHQADQFDAGENLCRRCEPLKATPALLKALNELHQPTIHQRVGLSRYFGLIDQHTRFARYLGLVCVIIIAILISLSNSTYVLPPGAQAVQSKAADARQVYLRGINLQQTGDYYNAIAEFDKAFKLNPRLIDAYFRIGNCYEHLSDTEAALKVYHQLQLRGARLPETLAAIAKLNRKTGHFHEAARAYADLGLYYQLENNYAIAIDHYNNAISLNPELRDAYCGLAESYEKSGHRADAQLAIDECKRLNLAAK